MGNPRQPGPRDYPGVVAVLVVLLAVLLPGGLALSVHRYLNPDTAVTPPPVTVAVAKPTPGKKKDAQLTDGEFGDWNFRMGSVAFKAKRVSGWTYDSCAPVDRQGVLAGKGCDQAVQLAYSAYSGHLKAVQVIMVFPSEQAAKDTADSSRAVQWRRDKLLSEYAYGRTRSSATGKFVVFTAVTADKTAQAKAAQFHQSLHADHVSYFLFRS
ncbi:hypothetical protein GCM10009850_039230 [Nonomuraea monospora]|uniref:Secreted protein n=1 Tax=Nonomuraea monospora TaxID=568818 RepID=A0ABN3CGE7_9ACTN